MQTRRRRKDDIPPSSACVRKLVPSFVIPRGANFVLVVFVVSIVFVVLNFLLVKIEYFDECVVREYTDARIDTYSLEP